ncbi:putative mitochondrial isoleucyl-tRNA synthetase [Leptomonas pyrrhocoris]|uniref:isoleucine--tRNA ligase n=1 Tax=Leptomonas pyrrhocoris TaxID=157538 RepID=A0A0N0VFV9_LEPPY|nr:putative mitochondrial isoleucyl-tRNA synthetase [Leptomonas pyrrhocoris]KPA81674.1 putative mitochondrial isoleucyl-tRNA synthetase [Leptomonas pyrrhocoris]|eukprot:XP_015660113.1 putative mitochondrial isoleucyl-tRNA synthetase [Leptomonas pyrrhocoris]
MFRCSTGLARGYGCGVFARTAGRLRKRSDKSSNPYPTAARTVIYAAAAKAAPHASTPTGTATTTVVSPSSSSPHPSSPRSSASSPVHSSKRSSTNIVGLSSVSSVFNSQGTVTHKMTHDSNQQQHQDPQPQAANVGQEGPLKNYPEVFHFSQMEEEVLAMWREKKCFETSMKLSEGREPFSFFDGPPFATGLPHYGHILAGTIKDTVTRFAYQTGHHVVRRFGWDCHGLPVEFEIDKALGIKSSHDVAKIGIAKYNEECEKIVTRYVTEWEKTVQRMGRWINFENDYKTMYLSYMESVWWVFSQLWEKKLVYRGFKVMPYSTACTTPLSNFEANSNYKDVSDPAVTIAFQSRADPNTYFLAWTTTPWTLPSNLSLCVNPELDYVKVLDAKTGRHYWLAEARLCEVYPKKKAAKKDKKGDDAAATAGDAPAYTVLEKTKGATLVGVKYVPLFPYFAEVMKETAFRIIPGAYVTTDAGTGIVHQAPAFGEDDYQLSLDNGIFTKGGKFVCPVDENGIMTAEVTDFAGLHVKEADHEIIKYLEAKGNLVHKASIVHSYPFCWRSDTPLIYKAVESWFVNVEAFRDRIIDCNEKTYWVPDFVKTRRFGNWLCEARDWNVSRNRYWGTPMPIWHSEDWEEVVCIGSVAELEKLSGRTGITNIHRQFVDDITIPSKRPGMPPLKRVEMVFDCWFESGSMPYAQQHYPFENQELFKSLFPADFVSEGLDQTRGWFYTLLVLGVALFDISPFRNCAVSGLVLAEDGKKMSKRLKNYPEPQVVIDAYGADALRMYIISSPVVRAEPLRFRETGVKGVVRDILLPLFNAAKFFTSNTNYCIAAGGTVSLDVRSTNEMDRWILASCQTLLGYVKEEMKLYHLYNVVPGVLRFVVDLSNWYVRMNRRRMKNATDSEDRSQALSTMLYVLFSVSRILGPIAPFVAEMLYQHIKPILPTSEQVDSVHYLMIPDEDVAFDDTELERAMSRMMNIVDLVRVLRDQMVIPIKRPVRQVVIVHPEQQYLDDVRKVVSYIKDEVNAFEIVLSSNDEYVETKLDANFEVLGKKYRKDMPAIRKGIQAMSPADVAKFLHDQKGVIAGKELTMEDVKVLRHVKDGIADFQSNTDNDVVVLVDKREDQQLIDSWRAREFVNRVQQLRKKAKLQISDDVDVFFEAEEAELTTSIMSCKDQVNQTLRGVWTTLDQKPSDAELIAEEDNSISGVAVRLVFTKPRA